VDEHRQKRENGMTDAQAGATAETVIVETVRRHHPDVQAIYLFGGFGTEHQWPGGDVDIGLLLPPLKAKEVGHPALTGLPRELEDRLKKRIDLVNLRRVNTVLQKEVIMDNRRIFTGDRYAAEEFEMLVISYYQQLNQERAEIIADGLKKGRFHDV
jgi:predicted nucleotidyltransferase